MCKVRARKLRRLSHLFAVQQPGPSVDGFKILQAAAPNIRIRPVRPSKSMCGGRSKSLDVVGVLGRRGPPDELLDVGTRLGFAAALTQELSEIEERVPLLRVQLDGALPALDRLVGMSRLGGDHSE